MSGYEDHPISVIEDRYGGAYSGGEWLAIAEASEHVDASFTRAQFRLSGDKGPSGRDVEAAEFWSKRPIWIAPGSTPEIVVQNLRNQSVSVSMPNV